MLGAFALGAPIGEGFLLVAVLITVVIRWGGSWIDSQRRDEHELRDCGN